MLAKYLPLAFFFLTLGAGCGVSTYQPSRTAFDANPSKEINDDDVRKAFEARPQLSRPLRVAFYTFDVSKSDDIERTLRAVPGVSDVYRIPPLMVSGQRRFDESHHHQSQPQQELSLKKLRLIAARAHADVVAVFDYGHRIESSPNGWVALTPLLIPTFFVPFLDKKIDSYLDTYLVDTRNGYLYAHISVDEKTDIPSTSIYHNADPAILAAWQKVLASTQQRLSALTSAAPATPAASVAAPAAPPPAGSAPAAPPAPPASATPAKP